MAAHVCPWWVGYLLASPLRRLIQNPRELLAPFVGEGMTVLEPGPGMGFFTLDLARMVGPTGRVIAVDIQPKMLAVLERRARKAHVAERIEVRLARAETLGVSDLERSVDLVCAFAVVHEMPDTARFIAEAHAAMKPGGALLLAEPRGHVSSDAFESEIELAISAGMKLVDRPDVPRSHAALLRTLT